MRLKTQIDSCVINTFSRVLVNSCVFEVHVFERTRVFWRYYSCVFSVFICVLHSEEFHLRACFSGVFDTISIIFLFGRTAAEEHIQ